MFYYFPDGSKFISRIETLEYRKKTNLQPAFYYYDHVYDKVDWSLEPTQCLDALYLEQAKRLRDKYDYLILCYSGGFDSTNILETFYFNGIQLDKIIIVGAFGQDINSQDDTNHNKELYVNGFPYIDQLGLSSITEKHDYTSLFNNVSNLSLSRYGAEWIDVIGSRFSPHHFFWRDLEQHVVPKNIGSKTVGIIFGKDKPRLTKNFTFTFIDSALNDYGNVSNVGGCDRISFYWDPGFPQILVKQLHLLKKLQLRGLTKLGSDSHLGAQTMNGITINDIVYSLRKPLLYKSPKSKELSLSIRDTYLHGKQNEDIFKFYQSGIDLISTRLGSEKQIAPIESKQYKV